MEDHPTGTTNVRRKLLGFLSGDIVFSVTAALAVLLGIYYWSFVPVLLALLIGVPLGIWVEKSISRDG